MMMRMIFCQLRMNYLCCGGRCAALLHRTADQGQLANQKAPLLNTTCLFPTSRQSSTIIITPPTPPNQSSYNQQSDPKRHRRCYRRTDRETVRIRRGDESLCINELSGLPFSTTGSKISHDRLRSATQKTLSMIMLYTLTHHSPSCFCVNIAIYTALRSSCSSKERSSEIGSKFPSV